MTQHEGLFSYVLLLDEAGGTFGWITTMYVGYIPNQRKTSSTTKPLIIPASTLTAKVVKLIVQPSFLAGLTFDGGCGNSIIITQGDPLV